MAKTYQEVEALTHATAAEITQSPDRWMVFLDTAARMYRYSFQEQMLIHAQRPDATACASFDLWRQRFNRAVMRGHKGIALIDETASRPRLKYVFDVSDTVKRYGGKDPNLWSIPPAPEYEMVRRLADRFQTEPDELTLDSLLHTLAVEGTADVLDETVEELWERAHNSFLEGLDGENLSTRLHFTMDTSLEYIYLARCGFNPRDYFGVEDFEYITEFNTLDALTVLGNAMSEQANSVLTAIGQITRQMRREYAQQQKLGVDKTTPDDYYTLKHKSEAETQNTQGGQDHGTDLPRGDGRDAVPGSADEGAGGLRAGQVREPAVELPENPEAGAVSDHADEGRAVEPSGGRGQAGLGHGGTDREPDGGAERSEREPESQQPDGVAAADEQLHPVGTGDGDERAGVQLTEPAPEEQLNIPDTRPDGTELSGLSVPSEAVDAVLRTGGNQRHGVLRVIAYHQLQGVDFAAFLRSEFCGDGMRDGGRGVVVDGQRYAAWYDMDGIRISKGTTVQSSDAALFTWEQAANRIASLLNRGLFQPEVVVAQAVSHERLECAEGIWYLHQDYNREQEQPFFMDEELFWAGGFPDETAAIAEKLKDPAFLQQTLTGLNQFRLAYAEDRTLLRWHSRQPLFLLERMVKLQNQPLTYPVASIQSVHQETFITEDEVDEAIRDRGTERNLAFYSFFIQSHTRKEQEQFLKDRYGLSGQSHSVSHADDNCSKPIYICRTAGVRIESPCEKVICDAKALEPVVFRAICNLTELAEVEYDKGHQEQNQLQTEISSIKNRIRSLSQKRKEITAEKLALYEMFQSGQLDKAGFAAQKQEADQRANALMAEIETLTGQLSDITAKLDEIASRQQEVAPMIGSATCLTPELLQSFVSKVLIHEGGQPEIEFRMKDIFTSKK